MEDQSSRVVIDDQIIKDQVKRLVDSFEIDKSGLTNMRNLLEGVTESLFEHAIRYLETSGKSRHSDGKIMPIKPEHIMEGIGSCKDMRSGLFNIVSDSNLRDEFAVITKALGKVIKNLKSSGCQGTPEVHQHLEVESQLFAEAEEQFRRGTRYEMDETDDFEKDPNYDPDEPE